MTAVTSLSTIPCPTSFYGCQYSSLYGLNCQCWKVTDNTLDSRRAEPASTRESRVTRSAPWDSAQPRAIGSGRPKFHTRKQILHINSSSWKLSTEKVQKAVLEKIVSPNTPKCMWRDEYRRFLDWYFAHDTIRLPVSKQITGWLWIPQKCQSRCHHSQNATSNTVHPGKLTLWPTLHTTSVFLCPF